MEIFFSPDLPVCSHETYNRKYDPSLSILYAFFSIPITFTWGARWLSGRVSGFETYRRRDVSLSKTLTPRKYWLITQEAVAPSRHD